MGNRNTPIIVNRAWGGGFFLDRPRRPAGTVGAPAVLNPSELGMSAQALLSVMQARYRPEFRATFDAEPSLELAARALASYVRTIVDGDSPFDRYAAGDGSALSKSAQRGLKLFQGNAGCGQCHAGPNLTDEDFHNTGVAWPTGTVTDEGRAGVSHCDADRGAFKTPTLREVSRTAPYMHGGSLGTLDEVIEFYDGGGQRNPGLDARIRPLHLSGSKKRDLLAFLRSLAGRIRDRD